MFVRYSSDSGLVPWIQWMYRSAARAPSAFFVASMKNADRVLVLDAGRVVQQGTHGELVAEAGLASSLSASSSPPKLAAKLG